MSGFVSRCLLCSWASKVHKGPVFAGGYALKHVKEKHPNAEGIVAVITKIASEVSNTNREKPQKLESDGIWKLKGKTDTKLRLKKKKMAFPKCPECGEYMELKDGDAFSGYYECPKCGHCDELEHGDSEGGARSRFEKEKERVHDAIKENLRQ